MSLRLRLISYNQSVDWNLGPVHTEQKRKRSEKERKNIKENFSLSLPLSLGVNGHLVLLSQSHHVNSSIYVTAVNLDENTHFHPIQEAHVIVGVSIKDNA